MSKINKFFSYLQLALGVVHAVVQVENAVPQQNSGAAKLNLVLNTVGAAIREVPEIVADIQDHNAESFVNDLVPSVVETLNTVGVFKTGGNALTGGNAVGASGTSGTFPTV